MTTDSTAVSHFGSFRCLPGKESEMDAALEAQARAADGAAGFLHYSYHRADDGSYRYFAHFASMEAMQAIGQNDAMMAAVQQFMPLLDGQPDMIVTSPVAVAAL